MSVLTDDRIHAMHPALPTMRLIASATLALCLCGCPQPAPAPPPPPPPPPAGPAYPVWIDSVPQDPQHVFAVGVGLRTFQGEAEQKKTAFANAVTLLAHSAHTQVDSTTTIHAQGGQTSVTESIEENIEARTKALMQQAEVVQEFVDRRGVVGEFKGSLYVLVRIPRAVLYGR